MYNSLVSIWSPTLVWRAVAFLRMEVWNSWCKVCLCTDLVQNLAQARTQLSCSKVQSSALRNLEHCITPSFGSPQAQPLPSLPASLRATGLQLGFYKVNTICVSSKFVFQHNLYFITVWVISQFVFHHSLYFIKILNLLPNRFFVFFRYVAVCYPLLHRDLVHTYSVMRRVIIYTVKIDFAIWVSIGIAEGGFAKNLWKNAKSPH